jgi:hypothetical protein
MRLVNLQDVRGMAKPYQVRQLLEGLDDPAGAVEP